MAEFTGEITSDIYEVMRNHPHYNKYLSPNEQRYLLSTPDAKNVSEMPVTNVQYNSNAVVDLTEPNNFDNMSKSQIAARLAEINANFADLEKKWNIPITLDTPNDIPMSANTSQNYIPMNANTSQSQSVSGLFTPELNNLQANLYQQEQQRAMQAQAVQFAKLSPIEQAQYGLFYGGQQLGGLAGNALGAKDPQLQLISQRNAISKQINMRDPESYFKAATLANQAGDREFAASLVDAGIKIESTMSQVELRKAQAQKAKNAQQAQTDSAQKRATVSDLEQKLATDPTYKPTPQEIASVRWIIANESKNRTQIDPTTGQLYIIEGLNIQDAAPNIANYLKQTGTTVPATTPTSTTEAQTTTEATSPTATVVTKGVTAVPTEASKIKAEEEAAKKATKFEEDTRAAEELIAGIDNIKSIRTLIKETRNLVKPSTTGLTGKILAIGSTEARELENKNKRIQANAVFEELAKLKSQSKTGATGFGALNLEELKTIQNKAANLDPVSPSYEKDLKDIDDYFAKIENTLSARSSRAQESLTTKSSNTSSSQAKEAKIKSLVDRAMADPRTKGTRAQVESAIRARPEFK
jgi:hypothetical protein